MSRIVGSATLRMNNLATQKRASGADVVSFTVGEPDFDTPQPIKDAAVAALKAGKTKYTPTAGIPELRKAIADVAAREQNIPCAPKNVLVAPAKQSLFYAFQALVDQGDEVLIPDPAWVSYDPMVRWAHGAPVPVGLDAEHGFRMTPEAVAKAITPKSRVVVLNSPSNPTGGVNTAADVKGILELAVEIYRHLQYDGKPLSVASLPGGFERTWTIDGPSKSYAMTGWRMGWIVAPEPCIEAADRLQSQSLSNATSFAQDAVVAALTGPQDSVATMKAEFLARRDLMLKGLRALPGVTCPTPGGAFYAFPKFDPKAWGGLDDTALAMALLEKANVATTPGSAFGSRGKGHLRLSYACSRERIAEGLKRFAAFQKAA
jgi:aspartate aminotransferase